MPASSSLFQYVDHLSGICFSQLALLQQLYAFIWSLHTNDASLQARAVACTFFHVRPGGLLPHRVLSSIVIVAMLLQMLNQRQVGAAHAVEKPSVGSLFVPTRSSGLQLPIRQHEAAPRDIAARIAGLQRQPAMDDLGILAGEGLILPGQHIKAPVKPVGKRDHIIVSSCALCCELHQLVSNGT